MSTTISINIAIIYTIIHLFYATSSAKMFEKGGKGMNPDTKSTNIAITLVLFTILYCLFYIDSFLATIAGTLSLLLSLRSFGQIIKHFGGFLKHTANIRRARIIYEETGQKSDRNIEGYASLNTLLLSGVLAIVCTFCMGAIVCYYYRYSCHDHYYYYYYYCFVHIFTIIISFNFPPPFVP
jgi:hypothetical protein